MAKCGNHGQIVPQDREVLHGMYWDQGMTSIEMAAHFGVEHKSVLNIMRKLGVPRRRLGPRNLGKCIKCGEPVHQIKHTGNGASYGKLCRAHWLEHRAKLAREYGKKDRVKAKKKAQLRRWYFIGAVKPEGDEQWLTKGKIMLRNARRLMSSPQSTMTREALQLLSEASERVPNSQT